MGAAEESGEKDERSRQSRQSRAGLLLPVGRIQTRLREKRLFARLGDEAAVQLTGVLEYLVSEVLTAGAEVAAQRKRRRISSRFVARGVARDEDLSSMLGGTRISGGGVVDELPPSVAAEHTRPHPRGRGRKRPSSYSSSQTSPSGPSGPSAASKGKPGKTKTEGGAKKPGKHNSKAKTKTTTTTKTKAQTPTQKRAQTQKQKQK
jgi:histone H2A